MLTVGSKAPDFELDNYNGEKIRLSSFIGKKVVLYFYPKDNTKGCTVEACGFRDVYDEILSRNAVVIGISGDSSSSHLNFKNRHNLPFFLLTDSGFSVSKEYFSYGEKNMFGKKSMGIKRMTFIIDENGNIAKIFPKVTPLNHNREILLVI